MTSETRNVDVAIVGAGTAGLNAWRSATGAGAEALLIDPGPLGTTCARVGCMPSKLLIAASDIAHHIRASADFGVRAANLTIDPVGVMKRVRSMRDGFVSHTMNSYDKAKAGDLLLRERAVFVDRHTVQAGDHRIKAKAFVLATGSHPWAPPAYRDLGDLLLTNDSVFELERVPESLLVVGAGPIGLELGQAFHRLGVRVTILDIADRIGGLADADLAYAAREIFASELDLHLHHTLEKIERADDGVHATFIADDGTKRSERYQYVLAAAGRRPNLNGMNLEAAGLSLPPPCNPETGQLGNTHFFLAGDVTGDRMIQHEAGHEGRVAGANAARFPDVEVTTPQVALALVFSDPQLAMVGARHGDLPEDCIKADVDFVKQPRAKVIGRNRGSGRLYAAPDGKLLGAELVGPDVEHLGHLLAWAIQLGLSAADVLKLPLYHPVLEEALTAPLRHIAAQAQR